MLPALCWQMESQWGEGRWHQLPAWQWEARRSFRALKKATSKLGVIKQGWSLKDCVSLTGLQIFLELLQDLLDSGEELLLGQHPDGLVVVGLSLIGQLVLHNDQNVNSSPGRKCVGERNFLTP